MSEHPLGPFLRRFLLEEMRGDRNLSLHTQCSYRDTFRLLLQFLKGEHQLAPDLLTVEQVDADKVRGFLSHIEKVRGCGAATRNQRLAAIRSLFRFISELEPALVSHSAGVRQIHLRRLALPAVGYLEKEQVDALIDAPDRQAPQGRRDHALLLFLYNSGARASEAVGVAIGDLALDGSASVRILGKGRKERQCPLWPHTARVLRALIQEQRPDAGAGAPVFVSARGEALTRFGVHTLVERSVARAGTKQPSLLEKNVSPHTIRHTTAVHLLRAGVDINTIRAWLGHVSLETTNRYAEIDLTTKAKALDACAATMGTGGRKRAPLWERDRGVMALLTSMSM